MPQGILFDMEKKTETKTKRNYGLVWTFLKGSRAYFLCGVLCAAIGSVMEMIDPQIIKAAVDNAIGGKPSSFPAWVNAMVDSVGGFAYLGEHLWIMALGLLAVTVVKVIAQYGQRVFNTKASETLVKTMRDTLFAHIERLPYNWHMKNHTGDIIQRCTTDVDMVRRFVAEQLTTLLRISIYLILALYFMFSMNWKLALIALSPMPFIFTYIVIFRKKMEQGFKVCDETEAEVSAIVQENLTGVRVVRAFGQERRERDRFNAKNSEYTDLWVDMGKLMGRFWSSQDAFAGLQILLVFVFGAIFCVNGRMTAGDYIAFISYNAMLAFPMMRIGRVISEMSKAGVSIDRLAYIMESVEEQDKAGSWDAPMNGDIEFDNINFSYEGSSEILHDVAFKIKAGSTLGVLGGTGSGKSTLMLLLDKMYLLEPGQGCIRIGGVDINDIRTEHLRKNISMVLQEPFLFSRSIAENISIAHPGMKEEAIREASRAACLDETVTGFTKGYDTFVGERGVTLSGGQKQRAAIARALTLDAPIMIFDDSLSAVDTQTDARIRKSLEERFGTATIIIISHRITTLSKADNILVLDAGRVAEFGPPDELKHSGGIYQKIYEIQSGIDTEEEGKEAEDDGR